MKISKTAFNTLNSAVSEEQTETGGILGSINNDIITDIIIDEIKDPIDKICYYEPNVDLFNQCIDEWISNGITFKGVFHTHFAGVKTLSIADKKYIFSIMDNMPEEIVSLYFPVFVLPDRELICYRAERLTEEVKILTEETIIV